MLLVKVLREQGWLQDLADRLRVARAGGYAAVDAALFLLGMYCWPPRLRLRRAVSSFSAACSFVRKELAAVADRENWATQSSMSRILAAVQDGPELRDVGMHLLRYGTAGLAGHADAQTWDTQGQAWQVLDFDPVVIACRQRGLPEGEDLPSPRRRLDAIAAPGYAGRKRGEVQVSMGALQHSGTGQWVHAVAQPGNPTVSAMLAEVLPAVRPWLEQAGAATERVLVRVDGAGGNVRSFQAVVQHGLDYLARVACYDLLRLPPVAAWLEQAQWHDVPDSGSGPKRQAAELGAWPWSGRLLPADVPEDLSTSRLVMSRYRAETKRGAGVVIDGWQYEVFATSLLPTAWPAAETVYLYYGRCGQENRFAQLAAEMGCDRLRSYQLGGHYLVVLVALLVWNLRIWLGARHLGSLVAAPLPPQPRHVSLPSPEERPLPAMVPVDPVASTSAPAVPPLATPAELTTTGPAPLAPPPPAAAALLDRLGELDWDQRLQTRPGWRWRPGQGLFCPADVLVPPLRLRVRPDKGSQEVGFRTMERDCLVCPRRQQCFGSGRVDKMRKEIMIGISRLHLEPALVSAALASVHSSPTTPDLASRRRPATALPRSLASSWRPPLPSPGGPWAARLPMLLPAFLRARFRAACADVRVTVSITRPPLPAPEPPWRASCPAHRQQRRLTWAERLARNALPAAASVCARITAVDAWVQRAFQGVV
jgi:hypothetical protein